MNPTKTKIFGIAALAVASTAGYFVWRNRHKPIPPPAMVFDGDSRQLKSTRVLATLDVPIEDGMNAVWCASFLAAWKTMESDFAGEPVSLKGSPEISLDLNRATDPRPDVPVACLYAAAGWNRDGITGKIARDMAHKFPSRTRPEFPAITPDSFVAYAYLEANAKFTLPYIQRLDAKDRSSIGHLRVPDIFWRIVHRFEELEGREFANAKLKGGRIDIASQDIEFRLNRQGAELKAEAKFYEANISDCFSFDRPFLLVMKMRGAKTPYFVMWIANAELLCKWGPVAAVQAPTSRR